MTIQRDGGEFSISCDKCSDSHDLDGGSFQEARNDAKRAGWQALYDKENSEWTDLCPSCVEDFEKGPTSEDERAYEQNT